MSAPVARAGEGSVIAEGLTRRFDGFTAVDHVSFAVAPGEIYGFLGPNGAGKTTTIRMLLGILRPSEGRASVLGFDIARQAQSVRERVGYVSQKFGLYGDLTVRENLEFYASTYGVARAALRERVERTAALAGLTARQDGLARDLSTGYRQRVALACAIVHEPRVLFLDEPTAGVDPTSRRSFWDLLYALADEGRTIFVTTHYMDEAENCRRLAFILGGKVVVEGSPAEIRDSMAGTVLEIDSGRADLALAALRSAMQRGELQLDELALYGAQIHAVAADPTIARERIGAVLAEAEVPVRSVEAISPSLEDVFIASVRAHRG